MSRGLLARAVGLVLIGALTIYVATRRGLVDALRDVPLASLPVLICVALAGLAGLGLQFRSAASLFGVLLKQSEWLGLTAVNTMVSYAVPARGGLVVRAIYMSRVHQLSLRRYGALTAMSMVATLTAAGIIGLVLSLATVQGTPAVRSATIFAVALLALLALSTVAPIARSFGRRFQRVGETLAAVRAGVQEIRADRPGLLRFVSWTVAFFAVQGAGLWVAFDAVRSPASFSQVMIIHCAASVSFVIAITPGGLGIKEGVTAFMAGILGLDPELALLAALIDRAAIAVVVLTVGLILGPRLSSRAAESDSA